MKKLKIDAPRRWLRDGYSYANYSIGRLPVRQVDESDWRKIMAVLRAADTRDGRGFCRICGVAFSTLYQHHADDCPVRALRAHLEQRK
jgi:hypothetical protein